MRRSMSIARIDQELVEFALDFPESSCYKTGMCIIRILFTVLSLALVPPQGWCCLPLGCHSEPLPATSDAAAPSVPSHCCCCQEVEGDGEPTAPHDAPFQSGDSHGCHCQASVPLYPADASVQVNPHADAFIASIPAVSCTIPEVVVQSGVAYRDSRGPACPLHILHCVWLC